MRILLSVISLGSAALAGCAAQTPAEQLAPRQETVRVCNGNNCVDQHRSVATFQGEPVNPEAERRQQALEGLAERNPKAAYDLGLRLLRGDGVQQNGYQAIQWMRKAGDAGLLEAQLALGRMYLTGFQEMGADPAEAEAWLSRAASRGSKEAQRLLPQAQAAKQTEHLAYQAREAERRSLGLWYTSTPYYYTWGSSGWYLR